MQDDAEERVHRYVRDNGRLAWRAVSAIEQGDAPELGRAMTAAQVRVCGGTKKRGGWRGLDPLTR